MGSEDRRLLLREIAELLAYARTEQFGDRETQLAIYRGLEQNFESIDEDVEDSAGNMDDSFPDRADQLREDWEWVDSVKGTVQDAIGEMEDPDWDADPVMLAENVEMEMERYEQPRKRPPPLDELIDLTPQAPEAQKEQARAEMNQLLDRVLGRPITLRAIFAASARGARKTPEEASRVSGLTGDQFDRVLRYVFQLLDRSSLEEFDRFFEHPTTQVDLDRFVRANAATEQEVKPWREAVNMRGQIKL